MAFTGLRTGEALGLGVGPVDLEHGTVRVKAEPDRVGADLLLGEPRAQRSRRTVPLTPEAVEAFRSWRVQQATERLAAGTACDDTGLVFTNTIGRPTEPRSVGRVIAKVAERPARQPAHPAALLRVDDARGGCPHPGRVRARRAASTALTSDLYGHVAERVNREATDRLGEVLTRARARR